MGLNKIPKIPMLSPIHLQQVPNKTITNFCAKSMPYVCTKILQLVAHQTCLFQPREKAAFFYPDSDSSWVMAYFGKDVFFEVDGALPAND
jgi:hypothetical protein